MSESIENESNDMESGLSAGTVAWRQSRMSIVRDFEKLFGDGVNIARPSYTELPGPKQ